MKKFILIILLFISVPLYGQHRALRIDSLEVNDKNVTGFFNDLLSEDLMRIDLDSLVIFTASDSSDSCWIFDTGDTTVIHAENPLKSRSLLYAQSGVLVGTSNASTTKIDTFCTSGAVVRWLKITVGGQTFWCPVDTSLVK